MSYNNKNLFDLLGNDVEDDTVVNLPPKEVVKKSTSSKKTDTPPPSANVSRANKNRTKPTGNEAAIKSKPDNRSAPAPTAGGSGASKPKNDRKSRSGKTDSSKKVKKAWGDDEKELETELAAENDAKVELEEDEETVEPQNLRSVEDYFQELKLQQESLKVNEIRKVEDDGSSEVIIKKSEVLYEPTAKKSVKTKTPKSKQFLEIEAVFSDQVPSTRSESRSQRGRGESRGGARGGRGGRGAPRGAPRGGARGGARAPRAPRAPKGDKPAPVVIDDTNFPSLS